MMEKCKTCTRYVNGYCALTMALPKVLDKCNYEPINNTNFISVPDICNNCTHFTNNGTNCKLDKCIYL